MVITLNHVVTFTTNYAHRPTGDDKFFIFCDFETPQSDVVKFNRTAFFNYMCKECGDFEINFNGNIEMLINNIAQWSQTKIYNWQKIYNALLFEYEPLYNYNRFDDDSTNTNVNRTIKNENDVINDVAGYDSGELVADSHGHADATGAEDDTQEWTRNNHSYGNIGVTSSQDLMKQEINIWATYNIYNIICNDFKSEFCIAVY